MPSPETTAGPATAQDEPCVLLKLGEIVLKGRNRQQFEHILHGNIRAAVRETGVPVDIRQREGVILLRVVDGRASSRWPSRSGWPRRPRRWWPPR